MTSLTRATASSPSTSTRTAAAGWRDWPYLPDYRDPLWHSHLPQHWLNSLLSSRRMGCAGSTSRMACWCGWQLAVVAGVVETPWTGSAARDAVRHGDAGISADAGLHGRDESAWTGTGLLITQRSRVQIPPPLLVCAG